MLHLTANSLTRDGIAHGFFGRTDGVSKGVYASLNCGPGSGDDLACVAENRRRVAAALGVPVLINVHQIHSEQAVAVTGPWEMGKGPEADGMATATPGIALGVLTADCAPVLFADPKARVIGAAHAGWKGALTGVMEATIARMEELGAAKSRIQAAIGPCISQGNYEVGPEFRDRFLAADNGNARFFTASERAGHHQFDLPGYAAGRLANAGIAAAERMTLCTYAGEPMFFSYRRNTHEGTSLYGRQVSAIALTSL